MKIWAEDSIDGLLNYIDDCSKAKMEGTVVSLTDLRLLKELYEEALEELKRKSDCLTLVG